MKKQVIIIGGGDSFKTHKEYLTFLENYRIDFERYVAGKKDWKSTLSKILGKNFEVVLPLMPNRNNAKYAEWKMWFEKFIPHFRSGVVLIGHSLGGLFLAKHLAETSLSKRVRATLLVAAPYGEGDFTIPRTFKRLETQGGKIFLYHSKNDRIVPFADLEKYQKGIPSAVARAFHDRGHFNQGKFPELVKDLRNSY